MPYRHPVALGAVLVAAFLLAAAPAAAQGQAGAAGDWTAPRTAAGHPDLQGIWANDSATPLERLEGFENRPVLTEEEFAAFQERAAELTSESADAGFLDEVFLAAATGAEEFETFCAGTGNYNNFWLTERHFENRTSLVVDPPTGRIPYKPETQQLLAEQLARFASAAPAASWEELGMLTRCITNGVPNLLPGYNTNYQIGADRRPRPDPAGADARSARHSARRTRAHPVGHPAGARRLAGPLGRGHPRRDHHQFHRQDEHPGIERACAAHRALHPRRPDTLHYEFTVEDDTRFNGAWTALIPMQKIEGPIFEYACHEGNYGLIGILAGARADEAAAAAGR